MCRGVPTRKNGAFVCATNRECQYDCEHHDWCASALDRNRFTSQIEWTSVTQNFHFIAYEMPRESLHLHFRCPYEISFPAPSCFLQVNRTRHRHFHSYVPMMNLFFFSILCYFIRLLAIGNNNKYIISWSVSSEYTRFMPKKISAQSDRSAFRTNTLFIEFYRLTLKRRA